MVSHEMKWYTALHHLMNKLRSAGLLPKCFQAGKIFFPIGRRALMAWRLFLAVAEAKGFVQRASGSA
jgi:hypothetical protein